jgi:hypothetical protein
LSAAGRSFLAHAFVKTLSLAQYSGATTAAARAHDERIGVGQHVYHLFRLPEVLEQAAFRSVRDAAVAARLSAVVADRERVAAHLAAKADSRVAAGNAETFVGPTWMATTQDLYGGDAWAQVASLYWQGFRGGERVYPYFSDQSP